MLGGSIVNEWDQIIRHLSVSSNEGQAMRLYDGTEATYWQSSGPQGKVSFTICIIIDIYYICIQIYLMYLLCLCIALDSPRNPT